MLERSDRTAPGRALQSRDRRRGPGLPPGSSFVVGGSMEVTLGENDRLENVLKKFRRQITKAGLFQALQLAPFGGLVLAPPLGAGALVEPLALHVLEQSRLRDLAAELLEDVLQSVVLAQRNFHRASTTNEDPGGSPGPRRRSLDCMAGPAAVRSLTQA